MRKESQDFCRCLFYSANALSRTITRMAEEEFAVTGFAPTYGFILMTTIKHPGIAIGDIAEIMQLTPSTLTRLIDKLESKGYLQRKNEGKYTYVSPTGEALKLEGPLKAAWFSLYKRYVAILGEERSQALTWMVAEANDDLRASFEK